MLISPTEPFIFRSLGKTSSLPERHGVDYLILTPKHNVGIQRKTIPDLIASITDGRLQREVAQIGSSSLLHSAILVIEGIPQWTNEGFLMSSHARFNQTAYYGLLLSLQSNGLSILQTHSGTETMTLLSYLPKYLSKEHHSLLTRPKPRSSWGKGTNHSFALHTLQSFQGVGPRTAEAVLQKFGGLPLRWSVTEEELATVPGIGKLTATRLMEALNGNTL